jgi:pimeloyl-ACP methyl ester carboxylesterase
VPGWLPDHLPAPLTYLRTHTYVTDNLLPRNLHTRLLVSSKTARAGDVMSPDLLLLEAGGLSFACLTAGPDNGPLALCLHGFPDTAHTYRHLLPRLAAAGYRAVAPFSRGYAPTAIPADGRYQSGALAQDAIALHQALGGVDRAVIIGHDWGAQAAYGAAVLAPGRWRRVVAMALPPGPALASGLFSYDQVRKSFYLYFFQNPLATSLYLSPPTMQREWHCSSRCRICVALTRFTAGITIDACALPASAGVPPPR